MSTNTTEHYHLYMTSGANVNNSWANHQIPEGDRKIILVPEKYIAERIQTVTGYDSLMDICNQKTRVIKMDIKPTDTNAWIVAAATVIMWILTDGPILVVNNPEKIKFTLYHDSLTYENGVTVEKCLHACGYDTVSVGIGRI